MQVLAFPDFAKRILYYLCKFHQQQLHEGEDYLTLKPSISICFLNHVLFHDAEDYHSRVGLLSRFGLLELRRHFPLSDDIQFHLLELPKFTKTATDLHTGLDIWLYFLRHAAMMDTDALPAALQKQPLVVRAVEELKMLTQSDLERERYEARRKAELDRNTLLRYARQAEERMKLAEQLTKQAEEQAKQAEEQAKQAEEQAKQAEERGFQKAVAEAEKAAVIRFIHLCERSLKKPATSPEKLGSLSAEELARTAEQLEQLVQKLAPQHEST
jgi:predicted transposase/invertase (TIGR01784 family)